MTNKKKILITVTAVIAIIAVIMIIEFNGNKKNDMTIQTQETTQDTVTAKDVATDSTTTQEAVITLKKPEFAVKGLTRNIDSTEAVKEIKSLIEKKTSNITDIPYTDEEVNIVIDYLKTIKGISTKNVISFIDLIMELCDRTDTSFQFNRIYDTFDKSLVVLAPKENEPTDNNDDGKTNTKGNTTEDNDDGKSTYPTPSTKPIDNTPKQNDEIIKDTTNNVAENTKTNADFINSKSESTFNILNNLRKNNKEVWNAKLEDKPLPTFIFAQDLTDYAQKRAKHIYETGDYSHNGFDSDIVYKNYGLEKGEFIAKGTGNLSAEISNIFENNKKLKEGNGDNYIGIAVYGTSNKYAIVILMASIKK